MTIHLSGPEKSPGILRFAEKAFFVFAILFFALPAGLLAQYRPGLQNSVWKATALPLKKGTELYFQHDTLVFVDMEGNEPPDYYRWWLRGDTLYVQTIPNLSIACADGEAALYKLFWSQNGDKLLLKPLSDPCIPRFTAFVSQSPWYRKREQESERNDWHFLDPDKDRVAGAALYSAYKMLKFRKPKPIVVAVMDTPIDYEHEDLKEVMWKNEKEIPGNHIDDDKNGFTDDVHGWFFNCSKSGIQVSADHPEETRVYRAGRKKFEGMNQPPTDKAALYEYKIFQRAKTKFEAGLKKAMQYKMVFSDSMRFAMVLDEMLKRVQNGESRELQPADSFTTAAEVVVKEIYRPGQQAFHQFVRNMRTNFPVLRERKSAMWKLDYNPDINPREAVSENPEQFLEKGYGAGFLRNPGSEDLDHGTHVAGIIGARRANGTGAEGIADQVKIMSLGVVPSRGDERDKDIANAIRYAADNGAKIINMSFAKPISPDKKLIDQAIQYAENKGVLMIHAAGNSSDNSDSLYYFPIGQYDNGKSCRTWLNVGNSAPKLNENLAAGSSNYGKKSVHLFAPGQGIFSTIPSNMYENFSGTSMASPVVAGVAALIWSYFPAFSAEDIREILIKSVHKPDLMVKKPGSKNMVPFSSLSESGGIVHAAAAVALAEQKEILRIKKGRK